MADTESRASQAARELVRVRWGTTRLDRMIHELAERRDELGASQRSELWAVLLDDDETDKTERER